MILNYERLLKQFKSDEHIKCHECEWYGSKLELVKEFTEKGGPCQCDTGYRGLCPKCYTYLFGSFGKPTIEAGGINEQ